jgi:hypothetical protein
MFRRLIALWLLLPSSPTLASWGEFCLQTEQKACTCREHCERKPAKKPSCHEAVKEPSYKKYSVSDACNMGRDRELLALSTYILPEPAIHLFRDDAFVVRRDRESDPRLGFGRIDLPPPRTLLS